MNRIDIDASNIDYTSIDRQYDFYLIENHGEKFKPNARIFDESLASKKCCCGSIYIWAEFHSDAKKRSDE